MTILQLNPPIRLSTTLGDGWCHFLEPGSLEADMQWTVFLDESGSIVTFPTQQVRAVNNFTAGRWNSDKKEKLTRKNFAGLQDMKKFIS